MRKGDVEDASSGLCKIENQWSDDQQRTSVLRWMRGNG